MTVLNHKIGRYIVLLPVLLLLVNCVYAHWLTDASIDDYYKII